MCWLTKQFKHTKRKYDSRLISNTFLTCPHPYMLLWVWDGLTLERRKRACEQETAKMNNLSLTASWRVYLAASMLSNDVPRHGESVLQDFLHRSINIPECVKGIFYVQHSIFTTCASSTGACSSCLKFSWSGRFWYPCFFQLSTVCATHTRKIILRKILLVNLPLRGRWGCGRRCPREVSGQEECWQSQAEPAVIAEESKIL